MISPILSFIIPSYNVEWCLQKALDSMLLTDALTDIEVIIVNDGSTDGTQDIAERYVQRFPQNVHLINKVNGGHGSAINSGVLQVTGKYFKVVDSDDWVVTGNLPEFIRVLKTCNTDVILTPFHQVDMYSGSKEIWRMYCDEYERDYSLEYMTANWKSFDRCCMFHGITYRTDFYRQYNYQLPEKVFYEDHEYSTIPFCYARSVYPVNLFIYQYLVGNSQQSVSDQSKLKRLSDAVKVTRDLLIYTREHPELDAYGRKYLSLKILSGIPSYYETVCILQKDKHKGRKEMDGYDRMLHELDVPIYNAVRRKSQIYRLLSWLHVSPGFYRRVLSSRLYSVIRKSHRLEKE